MLDAKPSSKKNLSMFGYYIQRNLTTRKTEREALVFVQKYLPLLISETT
jgi:hypothetical protein